MHSMTYNRQLSLIRRGMLLSVTQLKLQRLVFSNCQKTVVTLSICWARGCLRTLQPKALSQGRLSLLYQSSNRDWPQSVNSFFYHYLFLQMFHCGMFLKTARAACKPLLQCTGSARWGLQPQGYILRTSPHRIQPSLPELCVQMKPLLFTHTQLMSGTGWHTIHGPRALGLTNGKTNQEPRTPLEKLPAKLQAKLEEEVNRCQPWTHPVPHLTEHTN